MERRRGSFEEGMGRGMCLKGAVGAMEGDLADAIWAEEAGEKKDEQKDEEKEDEEKVKQWRMLRRR